MPVTFHPAADQIEANFFGPVSESNLRLLRIMKDLGQDGDIYEVYYQPLIGNEHPDFAVVRQGRGIQLIQTYTLNLSDTSITKDGNYYQDGETSALTRTPRNVFNSYHSRLTDSILFPVYYWEHNELPEDILFGKRNDFYKCTCMSVYYDSPLKDVAALYANPVYSFDPAASPKKLDRMTVWTKDDSDIVILTQIRSSFSSVKDTFTSSMQEALRRQLLSLDRDEGNYAVPLQGKQVKLAASTPGERHRIKGAAGSGKTTVLATRAINCYLRTREPVLILTYNLTLPAFIQSKIFQQSRQLYGSLIPEDAINNCFHFRTYDSFVCAAARAIGIHVPSFSKDQVITDQEWTNRRNSINKKLREAIARGFTGLRQYQTILVDELQDFHFDQKDAGSAWVRLLQDVFLKEGGEFVVFADPAQNVYGIPTDAKDHCPYTPGFTGSWNTLSTTFRLSSVTAHVAKAFQNTFCEKYTVDQLAERKHNAGGAFGFADPKKCGRKYDPYVFLTWFQDFAKRYNIYTNDICILAEDKKTLRILDEKATKYFRNFSVLRSFETQKEWRLAERQVREKYKKLRQSNPNIVYNPKDLKIQREIDACAREYNRIQKTLFMINHPEMNTLKLSTIQSFKGQEINTVILLLTNVLMKSPNAPALIYTALTRAKENLVVFDAVEADPSDPWYPNYQAYKKFFEDMDTFYLSNQT